MPFPMTALYTALCLLLMLALAIQVVIWRRRAQVSLGDGDHRELRKAIRAHANAAEHVPLIVLGLALLEANGAQAWSVHAYGSILFVARVLHAAGLTRGKSVNAMRQLGVLMTWIVMLVMATQLIVQSWPSAS